MIKNGLKYIRFLSVKENLQLPLGIWTSVFGLLLFYIFDGQIVFLLIFVLSEPFPTYQEMVLDRLFRDMSRLPLLFTSITDILALLPHVCHG